MSKPPESLPPLTLNRRFVQDFLAQDAPCCALGLSEAHGQPCAVLALRPGVAIPSGITDLGFNLGHTVLGGSDFELIHFAFEFYGFATYNVLLNPSNPQVRTVVSRMLEHGGYFILAMGPQQQVCAFRAKVGAHDLHGLRDHRCRIAHSTTTPAQYRDTLAQFRARPNPPAHGPGRPGRAVRSVRRLSRAVSFGQGAGADRRRHRRWRHQGTWLNTTTSRADLGSMSGARLPPSSLVAV